VQIQLIGPPRILGQSGESGPVRGYQSWALLARLLLAERELTRRELSAELFPDTADPLGSLRWCLAGLRRAVGSADAFSGDPVRLNLPAETEADVLALQRGHFDIDLSGELLEGIDPRCGPEFATWLLVQRQRVAGLIDAQIREKTLRAMWVGDHELAVDLAERGVRRVPFDESAHILLVKSLAVIGQTHAALDHVEKTAAMFRAELGVAPSPALWNAARKNVADPPQGLPARAIARSLLDSGSAAIAAGAVDAGLDCLRRATAEAERSGDGQLHGECLLELGTALVHSVRGYDDEGSILLGRAVELAGQCGNRSVAAAALRELGYVDALAGRRPRAAVHLERAIETAGEDPDLLAGIHSVIGFNLVDWGKGEEGLAHYVLAIDLARTAGNGRREAWALGIGGWGQVLCGHLDAAEQWLDDCLELVSELRWVAFRPWPLAVRAEVRLQRHDDPAQIRASLEETFALSCQLADPCWEGATARMLALAYLASGDTNAALDWITLARERCLRETDTFVAIHAAILADDAMISLAAGHVTRADATARALVSLAARNHMDGFLERGLELLQRLGG
jgi:DNA-binding SARP family transcriptional activator